MTQSLNVSTKRPRAIGANPRVDAKDAQGRFSLTMTSMESGGTPCKGPTPARFNIAVEVDAMRRHAETVASEGGNCVMASM
jgi:hypothetical protein